VYRTGPVILVLSMLIWAGTTFPYEPAQSEAERIEQSYAGRLGRAVSPVFEPMGGDWRTGLGLISAFAAREVFVSTMAVIFHVTDTDEEKAHEGLLAQMRTVHKSEADGGGPLFTMSSVIGLMLFFMIALQCLSTVGVAMKEAGSLRFAMTQLVFFNLLAYALAVGVVQGLRALGIS
jgi:ferrous iron transport protein B